jgi:hypothetical protein
VPRVRNPLHFHVSRVASGHGALLIFYYRISRILSLFFFCLTLGADTEEVKEGLPFLHVANGGLDKCPKESLRIEVILPGSLGVPLDTKDKLS